jgi:hypothetical protein
VDIVIHGNTSAFLPIWLQKSFGAWTTFGGGEDSTGFNVGGKLDLDDVHHIVFSAGRGFQNAANANRFSYYLGLEWLI